MDAPTLYAADKTPPIPIIPGFVMTTLPAPAVTKVPFTARAPCV